MPAKPKPEQTPPESAERRIDEFSQPGRTIALVGKRHEETPSIAPFAKADRVRLGLDEK